jgi:N-acetyl-anhydromuramyl-L-alanine amidase AmpD
MKFKTLDIKDKRDSLKKHSTKKYTTRPLSAVKNIIVHHSLTKQGSAEAFARYHVETQGWPGIGYHFVIEKDGDIDWCHDLEVKSYHVGNSNKKSLGVCLVGDFRSELPTKEQMDSLYKLLDALMLDLDVDVAEVKGHSEMPGYDWKPCPVISMDDIRKRVSGALPQSNTAIVIESHIPKPDTIYTVKRGDTLWEIAEDRAGITVKELLVMNPGLDPRRLRIGQEIKIS